jgi:isochorismate pyruvate lyase
MSLSEIRAEIDRLDDEIVVLLARREQQVRQAARYKGDEAAVRAPDRRGQVMARLRQRATAEGADLGVVAAVYNAMIDAFIQLELREHKTASG